MFRCRVEEVGRIADHELIEGALLATSTAADCPLSFRRDPPAATWPAIVPGYPAITQTSRRSDIDPKFERIGRDHGTNAAVAQAFFDFAPALRQIAAPISSNLVLRTGRAVEVILEVGGQISVARRLWANTIVCSFRSETLRHSARFPK